MPGVDSPVSFACIVPASLFAYGPVPGLELIPYFLGLLAWLAMAVVAVAWAPCAATLRRLRGKRAPTASHAESTPVSPMSSQPDRT